jgi:hypothetical protein
MNEAFKERIVGSRDDILLKIKKRNNTIANTPGGVTARHYLVAG